MPIRVWCAHLVLQGIIQVIVAESISCEPLRCVGPIHVRNSLPERREHVLDLCGQRGRQASLGDWSWGLREA